MCLEVCKFPCRPCRLLELRGLPEVWLAVRAWIKEGIVVFRSVCAYTLPLMLQIRLMGISRCVGLVLAPIGSNPRTYHVRGVQLRLGCRLAKL
jgi:hypothetical protein